MAAIPSQLTGLTGALQFDATQAQTVCYGGGQYLFYDPSNGTYQDSGGNVYAAGDPNVTAYGSPVGQPIAGMNPGGCAGVGTTPGTTPPATPTTTPATNSSNSPGILSGLVGLFSATSGVGSALNPPKTVGGVPMVYSAAAGGYIPSTAAGSAVANLSISPTVIVVGLLAVAVIAYFAFRKRA